MPHHGLGRSASLWRCRLLAGSVVRGAALGDLKAESVADVNLGTHERGDELQAPTMLDATDGTHLREYVLNGTELLVQVLVALVYGSDV